MQCSNASCLHTTLGDGLFCPRCDQYLVDGSVGTKAGVFRRWVAAMIDPLLVLLVWAVVGGVGGSALGLGGFVVATIGMVAGYWMLLGRGLTVGKALLGERVVTKIGTQPGVLRMFVREVPGKFLSGLLFGIGFFWALWDKDGQAWHDKLAGTIVVTRSQAAV